MKMITVLFHFHWAQGIRNCVLLVTGKNGGACPAPFPDVVGGDLAEAESELQGLENARIVRSRLTAALVAEAVVRMPQPCRVVVSGPDGFNAAARGMLSSVMDDHLVTVLSA